MSCECALVIAAKELAIRKGLDPDLVDCNDECMLDHPCPYGDGSGETSVLDAVQDGFVQTLEGRRQVQRFDAKLTKWAELNGRTTP